MHREPSTWINNLARLSQYPKHTIGLHYDSDDDMSAPKATIPLIDFSPFRVDEGVLDGKEPTEPQISVAKEIDKVCRMHGFLALTNFGISAEERDLLFAESEKLFSLPPDAKQKLTLINPSTNTGYAPILTERLNRSRPPEMKEAFNFRFPPKHVNPLENCPKSLGDLVENVMIPKYQDLARRFAVACAIALDIPESDFFSRTLRDFDSTAIRMLHYPPCDWHDSMSNPGDVSQALRIGEHTDFGMVTFLMVHPDHGPEGLQIKPVAGGEVGGEAGGEGEGWRNIALPETNDPVIIVNTGALMARWTNDTWKATAHRVVVTDEEAAGRSRYSIACFIDPDAESLIDVHPQYAENTTYEPILGKDYLTMKLKSMMKDSENKRVE